MTNSKPLVSVIMPAYNSEKYIGESIESVMHQDYEKWELLIVDDGSKDGTLAIAEQYAAKDNRIKVISQANQGVSVARNTALEIAKGEYVAFLDSDDLWDKENLSVMTDYAADTEVGMICAAMDSITENGVRIEFNGNIRDGELWDFVTDTNEIRLFFLTGSTIVRRDIIEKNEIRFAPSIAIMEDIGFYIKVLSVTSIKGVPRVMSHYCRHGDSATTSNYNPEKWRGSVDIFKDAEPYIIKHKKEYLAKYHAIWDYYAYRFVWSVVKHGMYEQAENYIDEYKVNLKRFLHNGHKPNDRAKCWLLLRKSQFIMKVLTGFK